MTHRKDLLRKGFMSMSYGTKLQMSKLGKELKSSGQVLLYKVVPSGNRFELYTKG